MARRRGRSLPTICPVDYQCPGCGQVVQTEDLDPRSTDDDQTEWEQLPDGRFIGRYVVYRDSGDEYIEVKNVFLHECPSG
jgi:rubredoxin